LSITAAIGYIVGLFIFALFMRRYRKQMIKKHMDKAAAKKVQSIKGKQND